MTRAGRVSTIVLLCLVRSASASAAEQSPAAVAARYFLLRPGLRWVYQAQDNIEHSREKIEVSVRGWRRIRRVPYEVVLVEERRSPAGAAETVPILYFAEAGFVTMRNDFTYRDGNLEVSLGGYTPRRILPLQPAPGQTWEETTYTSGATTDAEDNPTRCEWSYRIVGHETVTVPAGRFANAVRVQSTARHRFFTYVYDDWYAPAVGLVRSQARNPARDDKVLSHLQLLSFDRGDPATKQRTNKK